MDMQNPNLNCLQEIMMLNSIEPHKKMRPKTALLKLTLIIESKTQYPYRDVDQSGCGRKNKNPTNMTKILCCTSLGWKEIIK